MKHPLDIIENILEHSGGEARKAMQDVLRDKLSYMESIMEKPDSMAKKAKMEGIG